MKFLKGCTTHSWSAVLTEHYHRLWVEPQMTSTGWIWCHQRGSGQVCDRGFIFSQNESVSNSTAKLLHQRLKSLYEQNPSNTKAWVCFTHVTSKETPVASKETPVALHADIQGFRDFSGTHYLPALQHNWVKQFIRGTDEKFKVPLTNIISHKTPGGQLSALQLA